MKVKTKIRNFINVIEVVVSDTNIVIKTQKTTKTQYRDNVKSYLVPLESLLRIDES